MAERQCQHAVVESLNERCNPVGLGLPALFSLLRRPYYQHFEERYHRHCQQQRHQQVDADGPREVVHGIVERSLHCCQQWEEDDADAQRGKHHRHEVLGSRLYGRPFRLVALAKIFQIAVDDDDRVVDNHSQHHYQCGKGNDVELDICQIHHSHRDKGAQRDSDCGHDSRAQREQHHHHEDDDYHRDNQVAQKGAHAQPNHLGLVGNAGHSDVAGKLLLLVFVEHLAHVLAVFHYVVARRHLKREQHAGVSVLLDVAFRRVVLPDYARHIAHAHRLCGLWVVIDNGVCNLVDAVLSCSQMDGSLLHGRRQRAAHGCQPLHLQASEY